MSSARTWITLLLAPGLPAVAQTPADSAAIRATALDSVEGWYAAAAARLERALHPDLAQRIVRRGANGEPRLDQMGAAELVHRTRSGGGSRTPEGEREREVRILDLFRDAASVRATMSGSVDYMHLAKWNGRWVIVNVLWELKG